MAALLRIRESVRDAMLAALLAAIEVGSDPGVLEIYSGAIPASPETAPGGGNTLLATLTLSDPAGAVAGGVLTFAPIGEDKSADPTPVAAWGRLKDGDGDAIFDANLGTVAGQFVIVINTTSIVAGGPVQISSAVISIPADITF
jgi:hypothetical protein